MEKDDKEIVKFWIRDGTTLCQCYSPEEERKAVEVETILNRCVLPVPVWGGGGGGGRWVQCHVCLCAWKPANRTM